jgi:hypothetical protein
MYRHGPFEQFYRKMADMSPFVIHFLVQRMSCVDVYGPRPIATGRLNLVDGHNC